MLDFFCHEQQVLVREASSAECHWGPTTQSESGFSVIYEPSRLLALVLVDTGSAGHSPKP